MNDKRWAKKVFKWRGNRSTSRKETNRNMKRTDMKIVNNDGNLDIENNGEIVEGKKIQNRVKKEVKKKKKKRRAKKMESKYGKEKNH